MQKKENRPNILVFMTDQQRADSVYPYCRALTPQTTAFAKQGITFTNARTIAPHCCPARATFFSGLYPSQHGVWNNVEVGNTLSRGLYEGVRLFSEDLKESGYRTYYSGKWHVSAVEGPKDRGFDLYRVDTATVSETRYDHDNSHKQPSTYEWAHYKNFKEDTIRKEGQVLRPGYPTYTHYGEAENHKKDREKVQDAIDIIKNRHKIDQENHLDEKYQNQPWFQYVGTLGPHDPYFVPQKYLDQYSIEDITLPDSFYDDMKDKPHLYGRTKSRFSQLTEREHKEAIRHYLAYCSYQDDLFGEVLKALDETGEADNTLVIYLSDHGDYMAEHGLWCKGLPCFKGAYQIPVLMRWPKGIKEPGRIIDDVITLADFAPTFMELAGIPVERKMAGYSLKAYLENKTPEFVQDTHYTQSNGNELYGIQRSVTTKEWKYVYNGFDYDELYHLKEDPDEMVNVIDQYQDSPIVKEMCSKMWNFAQKVEDVCINPYILVGLAPYGPGIIE